MNRLFLSALLVFNFVLSSAAAHPERGDVLILQGTVGALPIHMNLTRIGTSLAGGYYYDRIGEFIPLDGTIDPAGRFRLTERGSDYEDAAHLTGTLDGHALTGTWKPLKRGKSLPLNLSPMPGGPRFTAYSLWDSTTLPGLSWPEDTPFAEIVLEPLLLPGVPDPVRDAVLELAVFAGRKGAPIENLLEKERNNFFSDYSANLEGLDSSLGTSAFMMTSEARTRVIFCESGVLVLEGLYYSYSGGAHGSYGSQFLVVDLERGETVPLAAFLKPESRAALAKILDREYRRLRNIPLKARLDEAGAFVDSVPLTDNFLFSRAGITFHYNIYELGSYAEGPSILTVSWDEAAPLLRRSALVDRMLRLKAPAKKPIR